MATTGSVEGSSTADRRHLAERVRMQAEACGDLGSPFYADLLQRVADDILTSGPAAAVLAGHERDPGPSGLALRLMGAVHRLVLDGSAPELALFYPSVGGVADAAAAWPVLRTLLARRRGELRRYLDQPPQTNEVGRSAVLIGGLQHIVARYAGPVRLFEIGASAGLNLRADQFCVRLPDGDVGPADSAVLFTAAWTGHVPPRGHVDVVERVGCDVAPVDPTTAEGQLLLTSYVWPDQSDRLARLRGAFEVAHRVPAVVERRSALDFVRRMRLTTGTTTVLWHSVMWQYLEPAEQAAVSASITELAEGATIEKRFARLAFEPRRRTPSAPHEFLVVLTLRPDGTERILGTAAPHGLPTVWE